MFRQKLKLLHVVFSIDTGGLEKLVLELCQCIDSARIEQLVCCLTGEGDLAPEFIAAGIRVFYLRKKEGLSYSLPLRIAQICVREKIDIVHTHDGTANLYGAIGARLAGVRKVFNTEHGRIYYDTQRKKSFNKFLAKLNTLMVCVSQSVKSDLRDMGIPDRKLVVIPNGIDLEKYKPVINRVQKRVSLGLGTNDFVVCSVGRLSDEKNPLLLINATKKVIDRGIKIKVIVVGDGLLSERLARQVKDDGLQDVVKLLGRRNDVAEILSVSDCFVSASNFESFGLAILEAMMCGVPVIATNVGGVGELVKDQLTGVLIDKDDAQALAESIIRVYQDPQTYKKMVLRAKEIAVADFDISKMVKKYEELYLGQELQSAQRDLRVLHLVSSGGLYGAEKVMLNLAQQLNKQGIPSWVMNIRNTHNPREELALAATNRGIPTDTVVSKGRFDLKTIDLLCDFIKKNRITVLHTHNYKANLIGVMAARKAGIPAVATLHGYIDRGLKLRFYEALDRFNLKKFNVVVFVDESLGKWFRKDSLNSAVIYNGIQGNGAVFYEARPIGNEKIIIGTVGRLSPEKGQRFLIEGFAKIAREYPQSRLVFVGTGQLLEQLQGEARSLGIEAQVTFAGFRNDVERFYREVDIYVSPSLLEHFPLSVLEAMSFGKPVVATNVGGVPKLVKNRETGILINSGSAEEIEKALRVLIVDKEMRNTLGTQARALVKERYSVEKMTDEYIKIYKEVL